MAKLWEILLEGRRRRNWSQLDLAFRAGVSASTVARTEQGRGAPNNNSLRRMAIAIGHDPDALVNIAHDGEGEPVWVAIGQSAWSSQSIAGVTTADRMGSRPGVSAGDQPLAPPPPMVRVPHFGRVSAVRTDLRETAGLEISLVPDVGVDFTVSVETTLKRVMPDPDNHENFICQPLNPTAEPFVRSKADVAKAARVLVVLPG
jgi:transcriptional regulator with XRE-family HTH domain